MIYSEHLDLDVDLSLGHPDLDLGLLNKVWQGIKSGELQHSQEKYHCGSSHCLAGWIVIKHAERYGYELTEDEEKQLNNSQLFNINTNLSNIYKDHVVEDAESLCCISYWELAQALVGLNSQEASLLFCSHTKQIYQEVLISYLNSNKRLNNIKLEVDYKNNNYLRVYQCEHDGFEFIKHLIENNITFQFKPYN